MGCLDPIIYQKLDLNPQVDYGSSAIGIMNMTPPESAVIASDIAVICFLDRFCGSLIISGKRSDVEASVEAVIKFFVEEIVQAADEPFNLFSASLRSFFFAL